MKSKRPRAKKSAQQRSDESAWRPGSSKRRHSNKGLLNIRCDTSKGHFFTVTVDIGGITQSHLESAKAYAEAMTKHLQNNTTFRPVDTVLDYSINGSPLAVSTPFGRKLYRDANYGPLTIFSDRESAKTAYEKYKEEFKASPQHAQLKEFEVEIKRQELELNQAYKKKMQREQKLFGHIPLQSQRTVMGEPAHAHVEKIGVITLEGVKWEWLHMIMKKLTKRIGQNKENLVAGTEHANTDMMFAENELEMLRKRYPNDVKLVVAAYSTMPNAAQGDFHVATKIVWELSTPAFENPFVYDPLNPNQPHKTFEDYVHALIKTLIPDSEPSPLKPNVDKNKLPVVSEQSFFNKQEVRKRSLFQEMENQDPNPGEKKKLK